MKKRNIIPGLVMIWILLTGCPYENIVPIDPPKIKINPSLLGTWYPTTTDSLVKEKFIVSRNSDFLYNVDFYGSDTTHSIGYLSDVDGEIFLNLQEQKIAEQPMVYTFYRIILTYDNHLYAFPITDKSIRKGDFANSSEFKKYIRKHKSDVYFYEEPSNLYKKHP